MNKVLKSSARATLMKSDVEILNGSPDKAVRFNPAEDKEVRRLYTLYMEERKTRATIVSVCLACGIEYGRTDAEYGKAGEVLISHGYCCDECIKKHYPDYEEE